MEERQVGWVNQWVLGRRGLGLLVGSGLGIAVLFAVLVSLLAGGGTPSASLVLASNSSTFRIEGEVRVLPVGASPLCEGPAAVLVPGVTRCMVFQVQNSLEQPIEVQTITMALDPAFPPPPSGCSAEKLHLPSFSGALQVPAGGHSETPGLPIQLKNTPTNQDDCQQKMLHFTFSGTASYAGPDGSVPDQELPVTGAVIGGLLLGAGILGSTGWILFAAARRRRTEASS